ncbi:MAG TPA: NAD(P)/FAD-dependent oxidoreductase, partial [Candidatus Acidoferrum sp.]|nr:NAD(P)/FAD-dependent oxidoreductase [Candidatus Acidoferrum sp.]
ARGALETRVDARGDAGRHSVTGRRLTYDAIIVGAGHNGLTTAAYLGRAGVKSLVLERRNVIGGAAVSEHPWPGYTVSTLSYVISLMPPEIIRELDLKRHGLTLYPLAADYYVPFPDGSHLLLTNDPAQATAEIAKFSKKDAQAWPAFSAYLAKIAQLVRPLLMMTPPAIGAKSPSDLLELARFAWKFKGLDVQGTADFVKVMTLSVAELLDEWFESPQVKAARCVSGAIGTYGGPYTPGTAYVLLHHYIGEIEGQMAEWAFVRGGTGAVAQAIADDAREHGAEIRTGATVGRILVENGRATGVALADGTEVRSRVVISNAHPKTTFCQLVEPGQLPPEFVRAIDRYKTRSGTVKVNLALAEPPRFDGLSRDDSMTAARSFIQLCDSMHYLERAFDDAKYGQPSTAPYSDGVLPTMVDDSLAPPGKHLMSCFTQYVPASWSQAPHREELEAFADRVIDGYARFAPNLKTSIEYRQVIGPYDMEQEYGLVGGNIMHGDLTLDQLFSWRPVAGYADYRTPINNLYLCGSGTHPGGGISGINGRNASREILKDLKRRRPRSATSS